MKIRYNNSLGQCLFTSLSSYLLKSNSIIIHNTDLRNKLLQYLSINGDTPMLIGDNYISLNKWMEEDNISPTDYLETMKDVTQWGGLYEIAAFAKINRITINIWIKQGNEYVLTARIRGNNTRR